MRGKLKNWTNLDVLVGAFVECLVEKFDESASDALFYATSTGSQVIHNLLRNLSRIGNVSVTIHDACAGDGM